KCGDVEIRNSSEQGDHRYPDPEDKPVSRSRRTRMGTRVSLPAAGNASAESYGLFTAAAIQDPYPYYREMREREPVHWSEIAQAWYFTRYRDVFELQDRPDLSVDRIETIYSYLPRTNPKRFSDIVEHYNRWLLYRDDEYHDRLKALFLKAMTPRAVERLRPMIQRRVDVLLDQLAGQDRF